MTILRVKEVNIKEYMEFSDNKSNVIIYMELKKIFIDGVASDIDKILVNNKDFSRFTFENIEAKIVKGVLTFTNGKTFFLKKGTGQKETWKFFTVYEGVDIGINDDYTVISVYGGKFPVKEKTKDGVYDVYSCDSGKLHISSDEKVRCSMWNYININLKK